MRIKVAATTANLGPGFDVLGMALQVYNYLDLKTSENFNFSKDHLVRKSYTYAFASCGRKPLAAEMKYWGDIPMSRGLGSSAACIVAGLYGANALGNLGLSKKDLVKLATDLEGHPDNVAPALLGGLVASFTEENQVYTKQVAPSKDLHFTLCIPDQELETKMARELIPKKIPLQDAIFNLSRLPFLMEALETGDFDLLKVAAKDRLHQPYRKAYIPYFRDLEKSLGKDALILISGAGSTSLVLSKNSVEENLSQAFKNQPIKIFEAAPCLEGVGLVKD